MTTQLASREHRLDADDTSFALAPNYGPVVSPAVTPRSQDAGLSVAAQLQPRAHEVDGGALGRAQRLDVLSALAELEVDLAAPIAAPAADVASLAPAPVPMQPVIPDRPRVREVRLGDVVEEDVELLATPAPGTYGATTSMFGGRSWSLQVKGSFRSSIATPTPPKLVKPARKKEKEKEKEKERDVARARDTGAEGVVEAAVDKGKSRRARRSARSDAAPSSSSSTERKREPPRVPFTHINVYGGTFGCAQRGTP